MKKRWREEERKRGRDIRNNIRCTWITLINCSKKPIKRKSFCLSVKSTQHPHHHHDHHCHDHDHLDHYYNAKHQFNHQRSTSNCISIQQTVENLSYCFCYCCYCCYCCCVGDYYLLAKVSWLKWMVLPSITVITRQTFWSI